MKSKNIRDLILLVIIGFLLFNQGQRIREEYNSIPIEDRALYARYQNMSPAELEQERIRLRQRNVP